MLLTTSGVAISGILTLTSGDSDASGAGRDGVKSVSIKSDIRLTEVTKGS